MLESAAPVEVHYGKAASLANITAAVEAMGAVTPLLLAPLDQFHVGGLPATVELAELAAITPQDQVLDVGSGLGGPSRILAALAGATVVGLDLTPEYRDIATFLARQCGLESQVTFEVGNALNMPFDSHRFDVAWSQHVAMNIHDRAGLYQEIRRVLKTGGRAALYDIMSIDGQGPAFPVPWASVSANSHLETEASMRTLLSNAGFEVAEWRDVTPRGLEWVRNARPPQPRGLGLHMVLGPVMRDALQNLRRSLEEKRLGIAMIVARAL